MTFPWQKRSSSWTLNVTHQKLLLKILNLSTCIYFWNFSKCQVIYETVYFFQTVSIFPGPFVTFNKIPWLSSPGSQETIFVKLPHFPWFLWAARTPNKGPSSIYISVLINQTDYLRQGGELFILPSHVFLYSSFKEFSSSLIYPKWSVEYWICLDEGQMVKVRMHTLLWWRRDLW